MGLQFLENGDLPHGGGGYSFILVLQFDLLDCHIILEDCVSGLEDNSVGALSEPLALLVAVLLLNDHLSNEIL